MSQETREGVTRTSALGFGALGLLGRIVREGSGGPVVLVGSSRLDGAQRDLLETSASTKFDDVVSLPHETAEDRRHEVLREGLARSNPSIVVACGGGAVIDTAKAVARPGPPTLVAVPVTLSGSEHTGNTARWVDGQKQVSKAGMVDVALGDPDVLVRDLDVLGPGALHAIAHVMATLSIDGVQTSAAQIAKSAVRDLVLALEKGDTSADSRLRFLRGAWMAAVGFGITGPRIGRHHRYVHRFARPGEHARFSARLLCSALLRSDWHSKPLGALEASDHSLPGRMKGVAETWLPRVSSTEPRDLPHDDEMSSVLEVLA